MFWCLECKNKQFVEIGRQECELMEKELAQNYTKYSSFGKREAVIELLRYT